MCTLLRHRVACCNAEILSNPELVVPESDLHVEYDFISFYPFAPGSLKLLLQYMKTFIM